MGPGRDTEYVLTHFGFIGYDDFVLIAELLSQEEWSNTLTMSRLQHLTG